MIHVVSGHICSGKTTYVSQNAKPQDVVIDLDRMARALRADSTIGDSYPDYIRAIARRARWEAITSAMREHRSASLGMIDAPFSVWIVHSYPTDREIVIYENAGAKLHRIDAPPAVLLERANACRSESQIAELKKRLRL